MEKAKKFIDSNTSPAPTTTQLRIIDLFAGAGGLSLGAARAGFDIALAVEIDKHAVKTYKTNFPKVKLLEEDISKIDSAGLLASANIAENELDGLIGGPPCQGFSVMGKQNVADSRNRLFIKCFELIAECKPKFFVVENVPGIMGDTFKGIRKKAFDKIKEHYTVLEPLSLRASDYGAATTRERIFFIGYRAEWFLTIDADDFADAKSSYQTKVRHALAGLPAINNNWLSEEQGWRSVKPSKHTSFARYMKNHIPEGVGDQNALKRYREKYSVSGCMGTQHGKEVEKRYEKMEPGEQDSVSKSIRLDKNGFCPTLRAGTGVERGSFQAVRPIHPTKPRVITPREAARLQGFPDWFQFAPSKWHSFRQIGGSVSPLVSEAVLNIIKSKLIGKISQL